MGNGKEFLLMDGMITIFAIVAVFVICWYILNVVAYWRIFTKAGEAGWKSLIPVYNTYVQYKLTWNTKMFFVPLALSLITGSLSMIGGSAENLSYVISLILAVIQLTALYKLAEAFGRGVLFAVGLVFLNPIFLLILGFSDNQYQGAH